MKAHFYWIGGSPPKYAIDCLNTFSKYHPDIPILIHTDAHNSFSNTTYEVTSCDIPNNTIGLNILQHKVDFMKLRDAIKYGGLFLDLDILFVSRLPDEFLYPTHFISTLLYNTKKIPFAMAIGSFASPPNNEFAIDCLQGWHSDPSDEYGFNACKRPYLRHSLFKKAIVSLVEGRLLAGAIANEREKIGVFYDTMIKHPEVRALHFGSEYAGNNDWKKCLTKINNS